MTDPFTASASVNTATPDRYAKQLASHLGRRCEVREETTGLLLIFTDGDCLLHPTTETLELRASASGAAELDHITHVVGSHLERFGQRHDLQAHWKQP